MKNIKNEISYDVNHGESYYLTIVFGYGQVGNSAFKDVDGQYHTGSIVNTKIGTGAKLVGNYILIGSIVTDTNPDTNMTGVTYFINGEEIGSFSEEVEKDNSSIYYTTLITFI